MAGYSDTGQGRFFCLHFSILLPSSLVGLESIVITVGENRRKCSEEEREDKVRPEVNKGASFKWNKNIWVDLTVTVNVHGV